MDIKNSGNPTFQDTLNKWNTNKNDKGLTYGEIKTAVDSNHDNKVALSELTSKGLNENDAKKVLAKLDSIDQVSTTLSKFGIKSDVNNQTVFEFVELDAKVMPGTAGEISPSDIQQGKKPVCYFLSAIAELVHQRPDEVLKLIDKNPDGTFTVTFPGLPETKTLAVPMPGLLPMPFMTPTVTVKNANKITLTPPSEESLKTFTHKGKNGSTWVPIIEKAYNEYCIKYGVKANFIPGYDKAKASDYGMPWEGIEVLTGNKADHFFVDLNSDKFLLDKMKKAVDSNKLVCACTIMKGDKNPEKEGQLRMSNAHVLSVFAVDPVKQTVTVRDPYGLVKYKGKNEGEFIEDKSKDGILVLPVSKFREYFTDIAIETNKKKY